MMRCISIFVFVVCCGLPAIAQESPKCSSYEAIYKPHLSSDAEIENKYDYRMRIEETGKIKAGEAWSQFVIEVLGKDNQSLLTRLRMPYNCGHGSAPTCKTGYKVNYLDGTEQYKSFNVFSLKDDLTKSPDIVLPNESEHDSAPYIIVFPGFLSRVSYTHWDSRVDIPNIEYFTDKKIPPEGIEVWRLSECIN